MKEGGEEEEDDNNEIEKYILRIHFLFLWRYSPART
jgi:hypothetical protein